ncbi:MAG: type II secretion system protein GspN [bacterium]|nr:type II secretion system protein GspN [bacterium]
MNRFIRPFLYVAFGFFAFLVFVLLLFPYEGVKSRLIGEMERGLGDRYRVSIESLRPSPLAGIVLKGISIQEIETSQPVLTLEKASVRLRLFPLLWGSVRTRFNLVAGKSFLEGKIRSSAGGYQMDFNLKQFDFNDFPLLKVKYGLQLASQMDGKATFEYYPNEPIRQKGNLEIQIRSFDLLESKVPIGEGATVIPFDLPALKLAGGPTPSLLHLSMEKGKVEFDSLTLKGGDLETDLKGKLYLARGVGDSRLSLHGDFSLSDKAIKDLPFLILIEKEKKEDGKYPLGVSGRLSKPTVRVGMMALPF